MKRPGLVAVLRFPESASALRKRRPVLLLAPVPGHFRGWLVCALSTRTHQAAEGFDEIIAPGDDDFESSGVKVESVIRLARLAVVPDNRLEGSIGEIGKPRLERIRSTLSTWLQRGRTAS